MSNEIDETFLDEREFQGNPGRQLIEEARWEQIVSPAGIPLEQATTPSTLRPQEITPEGELLAPGIAPPEPEPPGVERIGGLVEQFGAGAVETGISTLEIVHKMANWIRENTPVEDEPFAFVTTPGRKLPPEAAGKPVAEVGLPESETGAEEIARGAGAFLTPFLGALKLVKAGQAATPIAAAAKTTGAAAIADFLQPRKFGNLADALEPLLESLRDESLIKEGITFLQSDESDSEAFARLKNVATGLGVDTLLGSLAVPLMFFRRQVKAVKPVAKKATKTKKKAKEATK